MANDKNKQDWLIANIASPQNSLGDFAQEGLTQDNTQLLDRDAYKKNERIRETFTDSESGEFDEDMFDNFYDHSLQTYNAFVKDQYDSSVLNGDYYHDANIFVDPKEKRLTNYVNFRKERNPFATTAGHTTLRHRSPGDLSVREIAQTQGIYDPTTGKYTTKTPNDLGFWGTFFGKDTLVLSTFDEDGEHYDEELERMVQHKKGDLRFNADGKPSYEKLGSREVYGRQVLSPFDVLTVDKSWANKYDFMDSDGLNKSIFGTVMKTAATITPYLIPGVNKVWTALTLSNMIANELTPVLIKSSSGLLFGDSIQDSEAIKTLNQMEGFGRRFRNTVSDNAQQSMWRTENIFGLVSDVFGQIAQQRFIAQIPGWLGSSRAEAQVLSKAAERGRSADDLLGIRNELKGIKNWDERLSFLSNKFGNNKELSDIVNKWQRWSTGSGKALGMTYMAGIASTGIAEEAKLQGLDERDTAALFFGSFAALNALFSKVDIMSWTLKGIGLDDISKHYTKTLKENIKQLAPELEKVSAIRSGQGFGSKIAKEVVAESAESAVDAQAKKAWYTTLFASGRDATNKAFKYLTSSFDDGTNLVGRAAISESIEETTEETIADALKVVYNGARALGLTSTSKSEVEPFDVFDEMLSRYAMAALGGAMGGGLVGFQDRLAGRLHSSLPKSLTTELSSIILHGHSEKFLTHLEKQWKAGKLAPTGVTASVENVSSKISNNPAFKPVREDSDTSQNDLIYNLIKMEMDFLKKAIYQEGDIDDFDMAPVYQTREAQLLELKHTSAIRDDIKMLVDNIIDIQAEIADVQGGIKDGTESERAENQQRISQLTAKIKPLRENLDAILKGENLQDYVEHAIFNVSEQLNSAYGVKSKEHYATYLKNKHYELLTDSEKEEVDDAYNDYVTYEKRRSSLVGFERFKQDLSRYQIKYADLLKKAAAQRKALFDAGKLTTVPVTIPSWDAEGNKKEIVTNVETTLYNLIEAIQDIDSFVEQPTFLGIVQTQTDSVLNNNEESNLLSLSTKLLEVMRSQEFIDPEMAAYLKNTLKVKLTPRMISRDGRLIENAESIFKTIVDGLLTEDEQMESNPLDISEIATTFLTKQKDKLNTMDLDTVLNDLKVALDKLSEKTGINYRSNQVIDLFQHAFFEGLHRKGFETFKNLQLESPEVQTQVDALRQYSNNSSELKEILDTKAINPFNALLNEMAEMDGVTELKPLFDNIANLYQDMSKVGLDQFIINNKLDVQHLEYALNLTERAEAMLLASTQWESTDLAEQKMIGYSASVNQVNAETEGYEPLPVYTVGEATTLADQLKTFSTRLRFLLILNDSNINGTVRESKSLGVRGTTLYLSSLAPGSDNYKMLESLGFDVSRLEALFLNSPTYKENLKAITESTTDSPLTINSSDTAVANIRLEKDRIEQEVYRLFNEAPDPDARIDNFRRAINALSTDNVNFTDTMDIGKSSRSVNRLQEIMYLFQVATIDPKQFYKDIAGDLNAEVNELTEAKVIPFLNQELSLKQAYFSIMSKHKVGIDVFNEVLKKLAPKEDAKPEERVSNYNNREDIFTMFNSVFIDGIPGAGKTTILANYINNVIAKYGMNLATFAPHTEQLENLNATIDNKDTLVNQKDNNTFDSLFESILGTNLHNKIKSDIDAGLSFDKPNDPSSTLRHNYDEIRERRESMLAEDPNAKVPGVFTDRLNTNNKDVSGFLNSFKRLTINGKVPNVIILDESTHINSSLLEVLNFAVQRHNENNKEKISILMLGDTEQSGASINLNVGNSTSVVRSNLRVVNNFSTPKMNQSFRSFYSTINDNITSLRAFIASTEEAVMNDVEVTRINKKIQLNFKFTEKDGLIGHKATDSITEADVKMIADSVKPGDDKIAVITDKADSDAIKHITSLNAKGANIEYEVFSPEKVQGLERDYVIADLSKKPFYQITIDNMPLFESDINRTYTILSRAKKAAIINEASATIDLASSDEGVNPYIVQLNTQNLSKFKQFSIENIKDSFSKLADYDQHMSTLESTSYVPVVVKDSAETADGLAEGAIEGITGIQTSGDEYMGQNAKGAKTAINPDKTIGYTFHERLGVGLDPATNKIAKDEHMSTDDADLLLLARLKFGKSDRATRDEINQSLKSLIADHRKIRTGITKWFTDKSIQESWELDSYLTENGVDSNILSGLDGINDWKLGVLVKEFDHTLDNSDSRINPANKSNSKSSIAYIVLFNESDTAISDGEYNQYITLAALPNVNNNNVPKPIRSMLLSLYDIATKAQANRGTNKTFFEFNDDVDTTSLLESTNIVLYKGNNIDLPKAESYITFKENHSHLTVSSPMVISNDSLFPVFNKPDDDKVDSAIRELGQALTTDTKSKVKLNGTPFVLVSTNKGRKMNDDRLVTEYLRQFENANADPNFNGDIRMVLLKPKSRGFADWFNWNTELVKSTYTKDVVTDELKSELSAAENNYAAAKMIARFTWMLNTYQEELKKSSPGKPIDYNLFLPKSIIKSKGDGKESESVAEFMEKLQATMNIIVPATMGLSYAQMIGKLVGTKSRPGDPDFKIDEVLAKISRLKNDEFLRLQRQYSTEYVDKAEVDKTALEHLITKQLLSFIQNNHNKVKGDYEVDGVDIKLTKSDKGSLRNMVVAMRVAIAGGKYTSLEDDSRITAHGVFDRMGDTSTKNAAIQSYLKQLQAVLTDVPPAAEHDRYRPLFAGGIQSNVVYRRRNEENRFSGALPYALKSGTLEAEFEISANVQTPKLIFDINALKLTPLVPVSSKNHENNALAESFRAKARKQSEDLRAHIQQYLNNSLHVTHFTDRAELDVKMKTLYSELDSLSTMSAAEIKSRLGELTEETVNNFNIEPIYRQFLDLFKEHLDLTPIAQDSENEVIVARGVTGVRLQTDVDLTGGTFTTRFTDSSRIVSGLLESSDLMRQIESAIPNYTDLLNKKQLLLQTRFNPKSRKFNVYYKTDADFIKIATFDIINTSTGDGQSTSFSLVNPNLISGGSFAIDTTNWDNFKTSIMTKHKDDSVATLVLQKFIDILDESVRHQFDNLDTESALNDLSNAYIEASVTLKNDPEALTALQDFYAQFINPVTC